MPTGSEQTPTNSCARIISSILPEGDGTFYGISAEVHTAYITQGNSTKVKVALKVLRVDTEDPQIVERTKEVLTRETTVWSTLDHPNILEFFGLDHGSFACPALVYPFCNNGAIGDYLTRYPWVDRLPMIQGVAEGLKYLHQKDIVHGDLRPPNILMSEDGHPLLCFGCSRLLRMIEDHGSQNWYIGVALYQAPEVLIRGDDPHKASDIYAFAITSHQIWTKIQSFQDHRLDMEVFLQEVTQRGARPEYPDPTPLGTESIWKIFEQCWRQDPQKRLDIESVVQKLADISLPRQRILSS